MKLQPSAPSSSQNEFFFSTSKKPPKNLTWKLEFDSIVVSITVVPLQSDILNLCFFTLLKLFKRYHTSSAKNKQIVSYCSFVKITKGMKLVSNLYNRPTHELEMHLYLIKFHMIHDTVFGWLAVGFASFPGFSGILLKFSSFLRF